MNKKCKDIALECAVRAALRFGVNKISGPVLDERGEVIVPAFDDDCMLSVSQHTNVLEGDYIELMKQFEEFAAYIASELLKNYRFSYIKVDALRMKNGEYRVFVEKSDNPKYLSFSKSAYYFKNSGGVLIASSIPRFGFFSKLTYNLAKENV